MTRSSKRIQKKHGIGIRCCNSYKSDADPISKKAEIRFQHQFYEHGHAPLKMAFEFSKKRETFAVCYIQKAWEHTVMKKMRDKRHRIPKML
jgi:hypothetical protein